MRDCRFAFIVGHYKSGSTWLLNFCSLHPDVRGVAETNIFRLAYESASLEECTNILFRRVAWGKATWVDKVRSPAEAMWRRLRGQPSGYLPSTSRPSLRVDLSIRQQRLLRRLLLESRTPRQYCRTFFMHLAEVLKPREYLIEKTPRNISQVARIDETFPDSKLIAIYRDGRDVAVSDRFFCAKYGVAYDFARSVTRWRDAVIAQQEVARTREILTVSYEEMLSSPDVTARRVLRFLGLEAGDDTLSDLLRRSSFEYQTGRERGQEDVRRFCRKGVSGDWQNHFTESDRRQFAELAGDQLIALGYESDDSWVARAESHSAECRSV